MGVVSRPVPSLCELIIVQSQRISYPPRLCNSSDAHAEGEGLDARLV